MKKENFDEMLKETLREYVKDTESEPTEKVKFSKRHERNMEAIFKSIENGTLGNFEVEEDVENTESDENTKIITINKFNFRRLTKVAIFVILALIVSLVAPGIEAWRTDDLNLYGENQDEYAWRLPNDISEMLEVDGTSGEEYLEIFGYLPEGAKIEKVVDRESSFYLKFDINGTDFILRVLEKNNTIIDSESTIKKKIYSDNIKTTILCYSKLDVDTYVWNDSQKIYRLYGYIEENEILKIIENINYEKIERFF